MISIVEIIAGIFVSVILAIIAYFVLVSVMLIIVLPLKDLITKNINHENDKYLKEER